MSRAALLVLVWSACLAANAEVLRPRYVGEILPTPKQVTYEDTFLPLVADGKPLVSVIVNGDPAPGEVTALAEVESILGVKLPAAKDGDRCVISIGRTPAAEASLSKRPADVNDEGFDKEGYVLRFERDGGSRVDSSAVPSYNPGIHR